MKEQKKVTYEGRENGPLFRATQTDVVDETTGELRYHGGIHRESFEPWSQLPDDPFLHQMAHIFWITPPPKPNVSEAQKKALAEAGARAKGK